MTGAGGYVFLGKRLIKCSSRWPVQRALGWSVGKQPKSGHCAALGMCFAMLRSAARLTDVQARYRSSSTDEAPRQSCNNSVIVYKRLIFDGMQRKSKRR